MGLQLRKIAHSTSRCNRTLYYMVNQQARRETHHWRRPAITTITTTQRNSKETNKMVYDLYVANFIGYSCGYYMGSFLHWFAPFDIILYNHTILILKTTSFDKIEWWWSGRVDMTFHIANINTLHIYINIC